MSATKKVEKAVAKEQAATEALHLAIRELHASGVSLRKLAAVTGKSHETIRQIVSR